MAKISPETKGNLNFLNSESDSLGMIVMYSSISGKTSGWSLILSLAHIGTIAKEVCFGF